MSICGDQYIVKPEMKSEMTIDLINDTAGRAPLCSAKKQSVWQSTLTETTSTLEQSSSIFLPVKLLQGMIFGRFCTTTVTLKT
jgi:hypothetical protein